MFKFFKKKKVADEISKEINKDGEYLTAEQYIAEKGDSAAEVLKKEYTFYKNSFEKAMTVILLLGISFSLYVGVDVYKAITHQKTIETFFVTDQNNRIIPVKPVNEPYNDSEVINWASKAIMDIYTISPLDFRKRVMSDFQQYFTPDGLKQYREAIAARLSQLAATADSMTATPSGSPVIINKGVLDNRYYWQIMIPIQITKTEKAEEGRSTELRRVVMNIVRADQTRYPSGLVFTSIDESEPINSKNLR